MHIKKSKLLEIKALVAALALTSGGCQELTRPDTADGDSGDRRGAASRSEGSTADSVIPPQMPHRTSRPGQQSREQQRLIADTLYDALIALREDRLLTPIDDNAHARFKRVLALQPDNEIALEGLQDIVKRYVELAEQASRRGQFENAETYLERAEFVEPDHPAIAEGREALASARQSTDRIVQLDPREVASESETVTNTLAELAVHARDNQRFFLITAPNDRQARWIHARMQEAVPGYRLRGNIERGDRIAVRLIKDNSETEEQE